MYCKFKMIFDERVQEGGINSSKVYCKFDLDESWGRFEGKY